MSASAKTGRTLQDYLESLGTSVKRKHTGELLSSTKRVCILQEHLPLVTRRKMKENNAKILMGKNKEGASTKADEITVGTIKHLEEQKLLLKEDMERLEEKRKAFFSKQSDLVGVYMFGLDKISKLNDVRDAPDAILPGNQV